MIQRIIKRLTIFGRKKNIEKVEIIFSIIEFIAMCVCVVSIFTDYRIVDFENIEEKVNVIILILFFLCSSILLERYGILEKLVHGVQKFSAYRVKLETKCTTWEKFFQDAYSDAKVIKAASLSNEGILAYTNFSKISSAIKNGTQFEFISSNPFNKEVLKLSGVVTSDNKSEQSSIERAYKFYEKYLQSDTKYNKKVSYRCVDWVFPYSMVIVTKKDGKTSILVDLYGIGIQDAERRSFIVEENDYDNMKFYMEQFNQIKKLSISIEEAKNNAFIKKESTATLV